jgi:N-acetylneuraminate lyase
MKNFNGVFTALLTPFDKENRVNEKELEKLVQFNLQKGVTGFYVGGSTAEAFLLSTQERKQIMDVVKSAAPEAAALEASSEAKENTDAE